jgi:phosphodiesterase/alkaline phosphatase D-like protein
MKVKENGKIEWIMVKKAYFEWLPIRETELLTLIKYTELFLVSSDLVMLDTRLHGRDVQAGTTGAVVESPTRELLGSDQRVWMTDELVKVLHNGRLLVNK